VLFNLSEPIQYSKKASAALIIIGKLDENPA
jgi:hypothetical protein